MRVAVVGGTGLAGRFVVAELRGRGHEPVVIARTRGVDVRYGTGLDDAFAGADAVVDTGNVASTRRRPAAAYFDAATRNVTAAAARAGVGHYVVLSIVGVDRVPFGYYQAKLGQERLALAGDVPTTVARTTQFHEFAGQLLGRSRGPVAVVPRMRSAPVAALEVAGMLVDLVDAGAPTGSGHAPEMSGPQEHEMSELARQLLAARGERRRVVTVGLPGAVGRGFADGSLLPGSPGPRGRITFTEWLAISPAP